MCWLPTTVHSLPLPNLLGLPKLRGFEHVTSSPRYPQSNGKAENAVKTVKRLFSKCKETGQSEFLAHLDWRNTPTEGIGTSPAQRFLGRRCKTLLPMTGSLLEPRYPTKDDARAINHQKQRQQHYYDRQVKPLKPIEPGKAVRMQLPGESTWSPGVCNGLVGPRSYQVKAGGNVFTRNRRQLITMDHQSLQEVPDIEETSMASSDNTDHEELPSTKDTCHKSTGDLELTAATPQCHVSSPKLRRSGRNRKPPDWITSYVPS